MKDILNKVKGVVKDMADVAYQAFGKDTDTDKSAKDDSVVEYSLTAMRMLEWAKHAIHHAEVEERALVGVSSDVKEYVMRFEGKSLGVKKRICGRFEYAYDITLVNGIKVGDSDSELGLDGCASRLAKELYSMMVTRHVVTHVAPISEEDMAARIEDFTRKENLKNELKKF